MTGLQVTGHFHRYGHVGSTEMGGAKHFERPCAALAIRSRREIARGARQILLGPSIDPPHLLSRRLLARYY